MARGGRRPGAGRPRGSAKTRLLDVPLMLPALAGEAHRVLAVIGSPELTAAAAEAVAAAGDCGGALVAHTVRVRLSLTKRGGFTVVSE